MWKSSRGEKMLAKIEIDILKLRLDLRRKTANIEGQNSSTLPNDREMNVYNTNESNDHAISLECISSEAELDQTLITSDIITCNSPKLMCLAAPLCKTPVVEVVRYDAENNIAGSLVVKIPLLVLSNGEHHCAIYSSTLKVVEMMQSLLSKKWKPMAQFVVITFK
ncbi:hypothetical protein HHI36_010493 [Cryptolaemus montrouzieri]|uniref:Uncharacterized protein n=1 Tax=Cryptolaemus montrouzieri TaxID=559131 RepID=A0ABD2MIU8_9CUCU